MEYVRASVHDGCDGMAARRVSHLIRQEIVRVFVFQKPRQAARHCRSAALGDIVLEIVPEHCYDFYDGNVYCRGRHGILIANARASCRLIVQASEIEESSQSTVALENGSANGDGHVHDCDHGSWQMLAEHRMNPFYAQPRVRSSLEPAQQPPAPACITTWPYTRNLFLRRARSLAVLWQGNYLSKILVLVVDISSYNAVAVIKEGIGIVSISWRWGKMGREIWC